MPVPTLPQTPVSDADIARYVAEACAELKALAAPRRPRLRTLAYLLDMARLEAERAANDAAPPP